MKPKFLQNPSPSIIALGPGCITLLSFAANGQCLEDRLLASSNSFAPDGRMASSWIPQPDRYTTGERLSPTQFSPTLTTDILGVRWPGTEVHEIDDEVVRHGPLMMDLQIGIRVLAVQDATPLGAVGGDIGVEGRAFGVGGEVGLGIGRLETGLALLELFNLARRVLCAHKAAV